MSRHTLSACSVFLAVLGTAVAQAAQAAPEPVRITLGLYSFKRATEVHRQFKPVAQALSRSLAANLERPATVELMVLKDYEDCLDAFLLGEIDMVRFGPASYVLAKQRDPKVELLAAEREDSRNSGLIVVRENSPFKTLADLTGKRFAFGDQQSTIGRYLSQAELLQVGIKGSDLAAFKFLDRHDNVFKAVEIGDYDAGALHIDTWREMNAKATNKLRVLHAFDNAPKPWLARAGLEVTVVQALRKALLALDDPTALKALKVPGFAPTVDADYDAVRKGMELAPRFAPEAAPVPAKEPAPAPAPAPAPGKRP